MDKLLFVEEAVAKVQAAAKRLREQPVPVIRNCTFSSNDPHAIYFRQKSDGERELEEALKELSSVSALAG